MGTAAAASDRSNPSSVGAVVGTGVAVDPGTGVGVTVAV